jgi:ATP-dependent Clp protease adaptor protein ClpS
MTQEDQKIIVEPKKKVKPNLPKMFKVLVLNDDFTPMEFVIQLLVEVFNKDIDKAKDITLIIHNEGHAIAGSYNYEVAEQKVHEATNISRHNNHPLKIKMDQI